MAPIAKEGLSSDAANFQFIFSVLKHNEGVIKPTWDDVAKEHGISYGRNAAGKFRDLMKKHGYLLQAGKIISSDGTVPAVATPKKTAQANGKKRNTPASRKKRKLAGDEDQDEDDDKVKSKEDTETRDGDAQNADSGGGQSEEDIEDLA